MKRLTIFELKKIFSGKLIWIGIAFILFVNIGCFSSVNAADVQFQQEIAAQYEGVLNDEKIQRMLKDFMPTAEELKKWQGISVEFISIHAMQSAVHSRFANADGSWNGKTVAGVFGNQEITIGYNSGWFTLSRTLIKVALALAVLSIVIVSSVFSGDYGGIDNIILTSRYGRTKCGTAKVFAAFLVSLSLTAFFVLSNLLAVLFIYGTGGLNTSVLFCESSYINYIPFNISCKTMILYQIGLIFSAVTMLDGLTLLISAVSKTAVTALLASSLLFLFPIFFSMSETQPLFRIFGLLPVNQLQFSSLMSVEQIDGNWLYALWAFPAAAVVAVSGAVLSRKFFARHQVS